MNDLNEKYGAMLSRPDAIYISKDFLDVINEQSCDCCKLIIKSCDRHIRLTSEPVGEDGRIIFEEISAFEESEYPYEAELDGAEFAFDKFGYLENGMIDGIRFAADGVFLFVFALEHNLVLTMSKYDLFDEIEMDLPEKEATLTLVKRSATDIFCDEPIIAGYEGCNERIAGANAFFDVFHELSYHVTEGYRIILETEHFYISIGHNGVTKIPKEGVIEEIKQDGEVIDPFIHDLEDAPPWIDYESTLFVGEKLSSTERIDNYYLLTFTDFKLKLIPHDLDKDDISSLHRNDPWSYFPMLGAERHLTRKCPCGGDGELLLDFASDYVVRCQSCKRSTWAEMVAENAIKEWNEGRVRCDLSDITIE